MLDQHLTWPDVAAVRTFPGGIAGRCTIDAPAIDLHGEVGQGKNMQGAGAGHLLAPRQGEAVEVVPDVGLQVVDPLPDLLHVFGVGSSNGRVALAFVALTRVVTVGSMDLAPLAGTTIWTLPLAGWFLAVSAFVVGILAVLPSAALASFEIIAGIRARVAVAIACTLASAVL